MAEPNVVQQYADEEPCPVCGKDTRTVPALRQVGDGVGIRRTCATCGALRPEESESGAAPKPQEPPPPQAQPIAAAPAAAAVVKHPSAGRTAAELAADARVRLTHVERELERMAELRAERAALRRMLRGAS